MTDFKRLHPFVSLIYFVSIMGFSMTGYNPVIIVMSVIGGIAYYIEIKKSLKGFWAVIPVLIFAAVLNPVFSHKGATILFYWGNPITLESILYGICTALMLFSIIIWFGCFNYIMTEDKIVYILGRILPKGSLIISMTLRFVPRLKNQLNNILEGQKAMGRDINNVGFKEKIIIGGRAVSALLSWAFESSLVTSDAMQARGYGKKGRTSYSIFQFTSRDIIMIFAIGFISSFILWGFINEKLRFEFYPVIYCSDISEGIFFYILFFVLAMLPFTVDCYEVAKWKYLKSKI